MRHYVSARAGVGFRKSGLAEREVPERNQGVSVGYGTLADTPRFRGVLRWSFQSLGNVILTEFRSPAR